MSEECQENGSRNSEKIGKREREKETEIKMILGDKNIFFRKVRKFKSEFENFSQK